MVPTIEQMLQNKKCESMVGMRQMKCAILMINNLGIGINLLQAILADTDGLSSRLRDGTLQLNLTWRSLIGFECLQIATANPQLAQLFASASLQLGVSVLS